MNKYKKFLNQLFCNHSWEMQEEENIHGEAPCICSKCNKYAIINVNLSHRMKPRNYHFCSKCGNDLIRDSHIKSLVDGVHEYKCSRCGELNILDFRPSICSINITNEILENRFYSENMIVDIIKNIIFNSNKDEFRYINMLHEVIDILKDEYYYTCELSNMIKMYKTAIDILLSQEKIKRDDAGIFIFV